MTGSLNFPNTSRGTAMKSETDGSSHLRLRGVDERGGVVLEPIRNCPANDAAARARDTLVDAPTAAELLRYLRDIPQIDLGKVWDGNARAAKRVLDRLTDQKPRDTLTVLAE